jgi:hypothetical protein
MRPDKPIDLLPQRPEGEGGKDESREATALQSDEHSLLAENVLSPEQIAGAEWLNRQRVLAWSAAYDLSRSAHPEIYGERARIEKREKDKLLRIIDENRELLKTDIRSSDWVLRKHALETLKILMSMPVREMELKERPRFLKWLLPQKRVEIPQALEYGIDIAVDTIPELAYLASKKEWSTEEASAEYMRGAYFEDVVRLDATAVLCELAEKDERLGIKRSAVKALVGVLPALREELNNDDALHSRSASLNAIGVIVKRGELQDQMLAVEALLDAARNNRQRDNYPALLHSVSKLLWDDQFKNASRDQKTGDLKDHYKKVMLRAYEELEAGIRQYDLSADKIIAAWLISTGPEDLHNRIHDNISQMMRIERISPGICKFLLDEFGIMDFARYPAELLLRQRAEFDDVTKPYGVIIYPRSDHNGAFYGSAFSLQELAAQFQGDFCLRVIEAESKIDIARHLIRLNRRYNPEGGNGRKISLAIIGGHGTENSILFGGIKDRHQLRTQDFMGKGARKTSQFFEPGATFILASCSTGVDKGIAQELSNKLGVRVIAPQESISVPRFIAQRQPDGSWIFDAVYYGITAGGNVRAEYKMEHSVGDE